MIKAWVHFAILHTIETIDSVCKFLNWCDNPLPLCLQYNVYIVWFQSDVENSRKER